MNSTFRVFPEAASRGASEVDNLSLALLGITTFFSVGIALAIVLFVARYWHTREVNRHSTASHRFHFIIEMFWSIGPFIILMVMFVWGAVVYIRAHQPPPDAVECFVVAKQWMWKIDHQKGRREINELHVPTGTPVRMTMISEDVIHSFYVPAFRIKQDVIPGRYMTVWFEPNKPGTYHLFCAEYCGTEHSGMIGKVVVQTPEEYAQWVEDEESGSMAQRGRRLVEEFGCLKCHGMVNGGQTGPPLSGLYGQNVALSGGKFVRADDAYIRRAILDPKTEVRAGYEGVMPSFEGQIDPQQLFEITAYLRSIADATGPMAGPGEDVGDGKEKVGEGENADVQKEEAKKEEAAPGDDG